MNARLHEIRRRVLTGILVFGTSITILVLSEFGLRLAFPEKVVIATSEFHPEYIYSLRPNIETVFERARVNGGDVVTWRTNRLSFRGNELRTNADIRIVVYGDSNIQARFSYLENTFSSKLESYLRSLSGKDVEVINAGISGFGPDQSLIRLSLEVDALQPDIIVFHVFADNDFGDLLRNRLFDMLGNRLVRRADALVGREQTRVQWLRTFSSSLLITRATQKVVKTITVQDREKKRETKEDYLARLIAATEKDYSGYTQGGAFVDGGDHYDIDIALNPGSESSVTKVALMEGVLLETQRVAKSKGIQLLVLIQPSVRDMTSNMESLDYTYLGSYPSYSRERLTSIVERICVRRSIHNLNLFHLFLENEPDTLFFRAVDDHWNDAGQDLAARKAAEYVYQTFLEP